ncbi:MAG: TlpA family protein disulfide reductase [Candidatus Omnitrophica bacterium]|nr:TlpA family protein disulfide reductase [Candidatus Omnitrophota bacterium]
MTNRTIPLFMSLSICLLSSIAFSAEKNDGTTLTEVGQMAPDFEFTTLDGKEVRLKNLKGKVVYLHFFATWCGSCIKEMPKVKEEIWERFGSDPNFFFLVVGREETKEVLEEYREKNDYEFPIAPDPGREMYLHYATRWIPRHYLIDTDGKIIDQNVGEEAPQRDAMASLIAERLSEIGKEKS